MSDVVDFVDRHPCMDCCAGTTQLYTDDEGERFTFLRPHGQVGGGYYVESGTPDRGLVAYPEKQRIDLRTAERHDARPCRGTSYMESDVDFMVG